MEDQGKRLLLAVALALGLLMVMNTLFPPEVPPKNVPAESQNNEVTETKHKPADKQVFDFDEELHSVKGEKIEGVFSNKGGAVTSWKLIGDKYWDDKAQGPRDLTSGHPSFWVEFRKSTYDLEAESQWKRKESSDNNGVLYFAESEGVRVEKEFVYNEDDHVIGIRIALSNQSTVKAMQNMTVGLTGFQDPNDESGGGIGRLPQQWQAACSQKDSITLRTAEELGEGDGFSGVGVDWVGVVHSYFMNGLGLAKGQDYDIKCSLAKGEAKGEMVAELNFPTISLKPGDTHEVELVAYLGPKYLDHLEKVAASYPAKPQFSNAVDLGWAGFIVRPLLWLLKSLQSIVGNWGIAIILLTAFVKLITLRFTHKSMKSMQAMAKLKPQLDKVKEKYPDDRQKQQVETMSIMKSHGVNPLAGCLPMLVQIPIYFALYRTLAVAAELHRSPFVQGWIDDLTAPDPWFLLPIGLTAMSFVSSKLTPQTGDSAQQKMMQYGMPIMLGGFSFFFPAGLTLYIFTNTCLTAAHHFWIHKEAREEKRTATPDPKEPVSEQVLSQTKKKKRKKK